MDLLIIDDDSSQLLTLEDIFREEGFRVVTCRTVSDFEKLTGQYDFVAAILDLRLADTNGMELVESLRAQITALPIIIHTGFGTFETAKQAVNLGAHAYIEKSGDPGELVRQVHRAANQFLAKRLSTSEQHYRELLDEVSAIVWECDWPSIQFTFVSQHAEQILGYPVEQWLTEPDFWSNHLHPEDRSTTVEMCAAWVENGKDHQFEYRFLAKDGRTVWLRDNVNVVKDDQGKPVMLRGVMLDITASKEAQRQVREMESQLTQVSRVNAMGQMVAGIAHELNQPLAAISNFASATSGVIAHEKIKAEAPIREWLDQISVQAQSCGDIIRRLRNFVKKDGGFAEPLSLRQVVEDSIALVKLAENNVGVDIVCDLPDFGLDIRANAVLLQQVIINLLQNASDAVRDVQSPQIFIRSITDGGKVGLEITDNGHGVSQAVASKLFDPFVTTKPDGLGIGLAISKSIVDSNGGTLSLQSTSSSGTCFRLEFPAIAQELSHV